MNDGSWSWPQTWYNHFHALSQINVPNLRLDQPGSLVWKYNRGFYKFSVKHAWHAMRERGVEVDWSYLVWSTNSIPRHMTHLWLVMRKRLLTQDRMRQWHFGNDTDLASLRCPLCKTQLDSLEHLFFECPFSIKVWKSVVEATGMRGVSLKWNDIVAWLLPISKENKVTTIVGRLLVAASTYFVWQKRNNRIHGKGGRQHDGVAQVILDMVRLKLASIRFKKSIRVDQMNRTWKIAYVQVGGCAVTVYILL